MLDRDHDHDHEEPSFADEAFETAWAEGYITDVLAQLKSGKEATAFLCRAHPDTNHRYLVLKLYAEHVTASQGRRLYSEGRVILDERLARAAAKKTRAGRSVVQHEWMANEIAALRTARRAGADVPEFVAAVGRGFLMEYIGVEEEPAPQLKRVDLGRDRAQAFFDRLLWNVELLLSCHLVHGDLSPFNVLVRDGMPVVIDLPQAVDARTNPSAKRLLERDLRNVVSHMARYGIYETPELMAQELWERYERGLL